MFVPHATKKQSLRTTSTTANTTIGQGHIQIRSKYENCSTTANTFTVACYNCIELTMQYNRFQICIFASDETGAIDIQLEDREVRTLIGKTVFSIIDEVKLHINTLY